MYCGIGKRGYGPLGGGSLVDAHGGMIHVAVVLFVMGAGDDATLGGTDLAGSL